MKKQLSLIKEKSMQSSLGIYIEENLIKYAKVQKDKDNIKIEAFGTKFYENLDQAISQIVKETGSQKPDHLLPHQQRYGQGGERHQLRP